MFFQKFFRKDYRYLMEQGEKHLAEERFSDARHAFCDALHQVSPDSADYATARDYLSARIAYSGDKLAQINLIEAEHAIALGNMLKAIEHLKLVKELAEDITIREKAEILSLSCSRPTEVNSDHSHVHSCTGCTSPEVDSSAIKELTGHDLEYRDRFDLLVHTLPEDLPRRYAALGEKFAYAYLLSHEGGDDESLNIFDELLSLGENDIICYEKAIIHYRMGDFQECERLLRRSVELNPINPISNLGLAHLLIDTDRLAEALILLDKMISSSLLQEQSLLLKGDVLQLMGNTVQATETYSQLLSHPKAARGAAEKLVDILEKQGRSAEAELLFKRYLKGCC